ncbi:MAG: DJ-1/PfpI family protein [Candidatus Micrarchaeia archaeon]
MKRVLMVIAPENFRDEELLEPKDVFERKGFEVTVASKKAGILKGMLGGTAEATENIENVKVDEYNAIVFVGGIGASVYFNDSSALKLARDAYAKKMIVAAICIAPSILANAGILNGKKATAFPSEKGNLIQKGANFINEGVVVDGKIITASGPKFAKKFGEEIIKLLNTE